MTYNVSGAQQGKQSFNLALGSFLLMSFSGSLNQASGGLLRLSRLSNYDLLWSEEHYYLSFVGGFSSGDFSGGTSGKEPVPANAGDKRDAGLILGSGRSSGRGNGNPLQYSCLVNPIDRGAWKAIVHRVPKSQTRLKWLNIACRLTFVSTLHLQW